MRDFLQLIDNICLYGRLLNYLRVNVSTAGFLVVIDVGGAVGVNKGLVTVTITSKGTTLNLVYVITITYPNNDLSDSLPV